MNRNIFIWAVIWILSLVSITFFGGAISYGFFCVVTLIPVISLLYLLYVYFFFHMYQKVDKKWLVAGQTCPFYFTLVNDFYFLFSGIRVKFYDDFSEVSGLSENIEYEFMPKTGYSQETNLICYYRGEYNVGIKTVVIQDFFRLFCISYTNKEPLKVTVRPKLIHLEQLNNIEIKVASSEAFSNDSEPDVLVRDYEYGDDIRQMHWALSAKANKLMIRKRIGSKQQGVGILFSTKRTNSKIQNFLPVENKMLELDLALALHSSNNSIPMVHFRREDELKIGNVSAVEHFSEYYDFISMTRFDEKYDDAALFYEVGSNQLLMQLKTVFIILQEYSDELIDILSIFSQNSVHVVVYVISYERNELFDCIVMTNVDIVFIHPDDDLMEVM